KVTVVRRPRVLDERARDEVRVAGLQLGPLGHLAANEQLDPLPDPVAAAAGRIAAAGLAPNVAVAGEPMTAVAGLDAQLLVRAGLQAQLGVDHILPDEKVRHRPGVPGAEQAIEA